MFVIRERLYAHPVYPGLPKQRQHSTTRWLFLPANWTSILRKKPAKSYVLCGAEIWTLQDVDQKYLENFEMWCWRRMDKISWTDRVRNEEMLLRVNEETKTK